MAVRLTVVISQVSQGTSKQQMLEANLIAELIGCPGIDVSLIGSLSQVEHSTTDRLVLEGISGDFALVAWQSPDQTMQQLAELQISGCRSPHRGDPQAAAESGRRIYCFDWNRFATAEGLSQSLGQLLEERRVVTVSLMSPAPKKPPASPPHRGSSPHVGAGSSGAVSDQLPETEPGAVARPVSGDAANEPALSPANGERERAANARLDALVDDLNMLDL